MVIGFSGYPELDSDLGPSELSDIAEEPEDGLTDNEDRDSVTPQNKGKSSPPYFKVQVTQKNLGFKLLTSFNLQTNRNALNNWKSSSKLGPSLTSPSQFSAQPLESVIPSSSLPTSNGNSNKTYVNNVFRPTIQIKPESDQDMDSKNSAKPVEKIRIFVALFDYDPVTMSPNPDASDEELPFREGQLIKILGEKDADGFYWGEAGQRTGYVPCNMVSEVQVDDDHVAEELFKEQVRFVHLYSRKQRKNASFTYRVHLFKAWVRLTNPQFLSTVPNPRIAGVIFMRTPWPSRNWLCTITILRS